ncbi:hypothetical protein SERLA73DRAFT_45337, partial [Serpula lacrymans var. lacrymans S7.3]
QQILAKIVPRDCFNFNETGFFPCSPPDRGFVTKQMSGKKKDKFCITISLSCNAGGSEKLEPIYIGKSRKPRCFKNQTPAQQGFYYRNNKTAA